MVCSNGILINMPGCIISPVELKADLQKLENALYKLELLEYTLFYKKLEMASKSRNFLILDTKIKFLNNFLIKNVKLTKFRKKCFFGCAACVFVIMYI